MNDKVPITKDFDDANLDSLMGWAELTNNGKKMLAAVVEAGVIPEFAISFNGKPDSNGVYHNVELVSLSMVTQGKMNKVDVKSVLELIKHHAANEFDEARDVAVRIAKDLEAMGEYELAQYILAQYQLIPTWVVQ